LTAVKTPETSLAATNVAVIPAVGALNNLIVSFRLQR
jgi:hypothetical protein